MNRFQEMLSFIKSKHVYIQTHNFPDPDAIASAFGLSVLLSLYGIDSSICYKGKIERYSTNGFIEQLGITLTDLDMITDMNPTDEIILVDTQKGNSNIFDAIGNEIICIDHHPTFKGDVEVKYRYHDIRPELGACSTIIALYYLENKIPLDKRVATALFYGIKTDTMGLSRGVSITDFDVYHELYPLCDMEIIQSLEHCSLKFEDLKAYTNAINSIKVFDEVSFANTGSDCPEALIANISDFMLDIIEVKFTVVYSLKSDGIKMSVRSSGIYDAGKIANEALRGIGGGGGHSSMAGGFAPFPEHGDHLEFMKIIEERFLNAITKANA